MLGLVVFDGPGRSRLIAYVRLAITGAVLINAVAGRRHRFGGPVGPATAGRHRVDG